MQIRLPNGAGSRSTPRLDVEPVIQEARSTPGSSLNSIANLKAFWFVHFLSPPKWPPKWTRLGNFWAIFAQPTLNSPWIHLELQKQIPIRPQVYISSATMLWKNAIGVNVATFDRLVAFATTAFPVRRNTYSRVGGKYGIHADLAYFLQTFFAQISETPFQPIWKSKVWVPPWTRLELTLLELKNANSTPSLHFRWQHVLKNTLLKSISLLLNVWRRSRKLRFHPDDTPTLRVAWRGYPCRLGPFPQTCFCIGFCDATSEFLDTTSALWPQNYQTLTPQMTPQVGLHLEFTLNSHWTQTYTNPTSGLHFRCQSVLKKALLKSISLLLNVWCGGVRENYVSVFTKHPFWKLEGGLHAELACFIQAFFAQVSAMSSQLPWSPHWTPNKHTYLFAPKATFQVPAWII